MFTFRLYKIYRDCAFFSLLFLLVCLPLYMYAGISLVDSILAVLWHFTTYNATVSDTTNKLLLPPYVSFGGGCQRANTWQSV